MFFLFKSFLNGRKLLNPIDSNVICSKFEFIVFPRLATNTNNSTIMNDIKWLDEAKAAINDIGPFVEEVFVSSRQPDADSMAILNLKTHENEKFCIKLCVSGFGVVGSEYDTENNEDVKWYETPYALLSAISKSYTDRFQNSLFEKLKCLQNT